MCLALAPRRKPVRVTGLRHEGAMRYRLMELGLIQGARVEVLGHVPLGGSLRVRVGDSDLSLRRSDASLVDVVADER